MISMKKTVMGAALAIAFSAGAAQAAYTPTVTTTNNNFTMVGSGGGPTGGTNDVTFTWNGTFRTAVVTDGSYNATLSSPTAFSGKVWTAHHVNLYGPGTYTFDTTCVAASTTDPLYNPSCGSGTTAQKYTLTVGLGQIGAHMLFNWGTNKNIDVVNLWAWNKSWDQVAIAGPISQTAGTYTNPVTLVTTTCTSAVPCNYTGKNAFNTSAPNAAGNTANTIWQGVSIDTSLDADVFNGTKMIDGPFVGQSANFNVQGVPVPAAAWLLGSGLLGLVGVARRKVVA